MYEVDHRYLKFVDFSSVESWSSYSILGRKLDYTKQFPFVKIGKFLKRNKTAIKIEDAKAYKRATIKINGNGIFLRDEVLGNVIGTKNQFLITAKQFLLSKIDARNGAFGVVPNELDGGIITGNFWTFDVDYSIINPHFLTLITKTKAFQNLCQTASVGTTNRNYLQERDFLNFQIPLPTITEQKAILDDYQQKIENAKQLETKAQILEQSIEKYLFEELGIDFGAKIRNKNILNTIDYSKIDRWSVDYLNKFSRLAFLSKIKYPVVKLRTIVNNFQYGLSEKAVLENIGLPMIRMNNIFNSELLLKDLKYLKNDIKFEKYILNKGDLLFNRTNSKELVGKTAVYNEEGRYTFASYLIRVVVNNDKSDVNYINYLFNSKILQIQKDMVSRQITGQANINSQEMLDFLFPLPPLEKQREIAKHISAIKDNIKSLKQNAETLKAEAEKEFEEKIFN